jgi:leucyl aminopeptidase
MSLTLAHALAVPAHASQVFILPRGTTALPAAAAGDLSAEAQQYVATALADEQPLVHLNHFSHHHYFVVLADKPTPEQVAEALRRSGHSLHGLLKKEKVTEIFVHNLSSTPDAALLLAEGLALSAYHFEGYKTDAKSRAAATLTAVSVVGEAATPTAVAELDGLLQGVFLARDLVNAPVNKLNAVQLAESMATAGDQAGFTTDISTCPKLKPCAWGACWP